jgi:hypothetical protein
MTIAKNVKLKIIELIQAYIQKNMGEEPNTICLTWLEENEFLALTSDDVGGDLAGKISKHGARKAIGDKLFGVRVIWGADKFEVKKVNDEEQRRLIETFRTGKKSYPLSPPTK